MENTKLKWDNKDFVLEQVGYNGHALEYASEELKNDKEVVLVAVKQEGIALEYASKELRNDKELILEAIKQNPQIIKFDFIKQTPEIVSLICLK